jgi:hypothetical protein
LVYRPSRARAKRYLLPEALRPMVYEYFHRSQLSAHLGVTKTLNRIAKVFYWPNMRCDVAALVRSCQDCQRAKPAQDSRIGLHSAKVVTRPMERFFIDFVGPIVRSRKGNVAILVVLDGFSKFVCLYPVHRISAELFKTCLVERFFHLLVSRKKSFRIMLPSSGLRPFVIYASPGESGISPLRRITLKRLRWSVLIVT